MKNIIRLSTFLMLLSLISCNEDKFSPIVEIDIPPHTPRLVIRADWSAGSDSLVVFVSKSRGVLDKTLTNFSQTSPPYWNGKDSIRYVTEYYDTVPNTKVELLRNGQLLGTIPYFNKGYHYAKGLLKLDTISGTTYTLRVSAPNFETVEASQNIQKKFTVLRGGFKANGAVYTDPTDPFSSPEKGDELTIEFQDNAEDENYYILEPVDGNRYGTTVIATRDSLGKTYTAQIYPRSVDPVVEDGFLPDRTFNGKSYIWRFWTYPYNYFNGQNTGSFQSKLKSGDKLRMQMRSASKDYVLFLKTLSLSRDAQDNPFFTEPVILHSNVKKGYGIFTIGSVQTVTLVLP